MYRGSHCRGRMRTLAAILALAASGLVAGLQYFGFIRAPGESLFLLSDTRDGETSPWLGIGGSLDREHGVIAVEKEGRQVRPGLCDPKVRDGRMTTKGAITLWPDGRRRGARASLLLGGGAATEAGRLWSDHAG